LGFMTGWAIMGGGSGAACVMKGAFGGGPLLTPADPARYATGLEKAAAAATAAA
jgi:hypothetical protein